MLHNFFIPVKTSVSFNDKGDDLGEDDAKGIFLSSWQALFPPLKKKVLFFLSIGPSMNTQRKFF